MDEARVTVHDDLLEHEKTSKKSSCGNPLDGDQILNPLQRRGNITSHQVPVNVIPVIVPTKGFFAPNCKNTDANNKKQKLSLYYHHPFNLQQTQQKTKSNSKQRSIYHLTIKNHEGLLWNFQQEKRCQIRVEELTSHIE